MVIWHAIVLGILQGLAEFFPISSSAHLELVPWMFGWDDFGGDASLKNGFDVALHLGTLAGALAYFRGDIWGYVRAPKASVLGRQRWWLLGSAVPAALVGALLTSWLESVGDRVGLIVVMLVVFGALLWLADRQAAPIAPVANPAPASPAPAADPAPLDQQLPPKTILAMALAQVLSLVPGVSRSGVTITAGLFWGLPRQAATRFSFLMGLPIIAGAGLYKFIDIGGAGGIPADYRAGFIWGVLTSAVSAWLAIWGLMRLLQRLSFAPFAIERFALATLALSLILAGVR